jgi:DNA replication protein DnaC
VFFTGSAGTGKSFLLQYLCERVIKRDDGTFFTASTGIAGSALFPLTSHFNTSVV